ncbi:MAG: cupin fold metalloprotein, WbuC family [Candidatus Dadabacteria bacterium]|nr:MAG: cupin fold metalloprotein, WbuC family [Candidatus Dadabacteria bacterium]
MKTRLESEEVLYSAEDITAIGREDINHLIEMAKANRRKRIRICCHPNLESPFHEMIIVMHCSNYIRPHAHTLKDESYHIVEGAMTIVFFDSNGAVIRSIKLDAGRRDLPFYCRVPANTFHTVIFDTEWAVFHETTLGPFDRSDTHYAPWSPSEDDSDKIVEYISTLRRIGTK